MATQNTSIPGSGYGNAYIDSLIWGCKWDGAPVTYNFGSGYDAASGLNGVDWLAPEKAAFRTALANYSAVCNLSFAETSDRASANIVWWLAPTSVMGQNGLGMQEVPNGAHNQIAGYFNYQHQSWDYLAPGQYGYVTIIHELGHGMGLAHPHDGGSEADHSKFPGVTAAFGSYGTYGLNQGIWSTMSYNDGWNQAPLTSYAYGAQGTLMALDIAALQKLYGANTAWHSGDDVYNLVLANAAGTGWACIWDGGGNDTISAAGALGAVSIDLTAATLTGANAGGVVSHAAGVVGGYTIANGVVIENAIGGAGNDNLTGNAANNLLDGGAGADKMSGGLGDDTYIVDSSADAVLEKSGQGTDTVYASVSHTLAANVENLVLLAGAGNASATGNALANALQGNDGDNILDGKAGADSMAGGAGDDLYIVDNAADAVLEQAGAGYDTVQASVSYTLSANVEKLVLSGSGALNGSGNADANVLLGNSGANRLYGGAGNDTITPGNGADTVQPGAGNDTIILTETASAKDVVQFAHAGAANVDTIVGFAPRSDSVMLTIGDFGGVQLANAAGLDIAAALAAGRFLEAGLAADQALAYVPTAAAKNLLILSSLTGDSYASAIGGGSLGIASDAAFGADKALAAAYYDSARAQAVIGFVENTDHGTANVIDATDDFIEVVRIGMAPAAYTVANLDGSIGAWLG
jgi:serralysin